MAHPEDNQKPSEHEFPATGLDVSPHYATRKIEEDSTRSKDREGDSEGSQGTLLGDVRM